MMVNYQKATFMEITNYYQVSDHVATSGQPTQEQFQIIATADYDAIINLALPTSTNALANEGAIVAGLGMTYFHIPVVWEAPQLDDVQLFFGVMELLKTRRVWVHCALNWRVSCFVYLYQKHILKLPEDEARTPMTELWQPEGVWQQLIQDAELAFR